jgi:hypothetical protein
MSEQDEFERPRSDKEVFDIFKNLLIALYVLVAVVLAVTSGIGLTHWGWFILWIILPVVPYALAFG